MQALARLQPVRGRLERAAITRAGAPVYVDYAHTPDGLETVLKALRPHVSGKLIVVFGAAVAGTMLLVMRWHRANQRRHDAVATIGERHH